MKQILDSGSSGTRVYNLGTGNFSLGMFPYHEHRKNRITTTTKSMSHHANRDQNYNNIYSHMYILKPQSQQNHNQEKERLCCSSWTLLRQLVENLCPTGNGMTMNIIVEAHTCNWSCFTPARPPKIVKITFFGKQSGIENVLLMYFEQIVRFFAIAQQTYLNYFAKT